MPSNLLSMAMERLLERGVTVSLFSLVIAGSEEEEEEEEEENMEAGELSFTESKGDIRRDKNKDQSHLGDFPHFPKEYFCLESRCFVYILIIECNWISCVEAYI